MKVIDNQGRLFGKINIFDLFVILLLLSMAPMLYFGHKMLKRESELNLDYKKTQIFVTIRISSILPEIAEKIKLGDEQIVITKNYKTDTVARVDKIIANMPSEIVSFETVGKEWIFVGHPKYRDVDLYICVNCLETPEGFILNEIPIKIGKSFLFTTRLYSLEGLVTNIDDKDKIQ